MATFMTFVAARMLSNTPPVSRGNPTVMSAVCFHSSPTLLYVWFSLVMQRGMLPATSTPVSMVTNVRGGGGGGGGGGPHCKFPGCVKPCYREPNGRVHEFCGRTHAQQYMASKSTA